MTRGGSPARPDRPRSLAWTVRRRSRIRSRRSDNELGLRHPREVPPYRPMLASTGLPGGSLLEYCAEPKMDGWRCMIEVFSGRLTVRSRNGRVMTEAVPELAPIASVGRSLVLDGELCAGAADDPALGTMSSFYRLGGRLAGRPRSTSTPITFLAFDILALEGETLVDRPCRERRRILADVDLGPVRLIPRYDGADAADLLRAAESLDIEGVVLKALDSPYRPGRAPARTQSWWKIKQPGWTAAGHSERRRPPERRSA